MRMIIDTDPGMGTRGPIPRTGWPCCSPLGSPEVTVEAITVVAGNVPTSHSWPNLHHLLQLAGRSDIVVRAGAASPLTTERLAQNAGLRMREGMSSDVPDVALEDDLHLYDSLAMAAAVSDGVVETRPALVQVETGEGPAHGMTGTWTHDVLRRVLTGLDPNAEVAVDVDVDRFEHLFRAHVLTPLESLPRQPD